MPVGVRRGIEVSSFYVVGRGVTITSPDPDVDEVIQDFFNNPKNQSELGYSGLLRRIQARWTDGNIYSILFGDPKTGEQLIRSIDPIEIVEIVQPCVGAEGGEELIGIWNSNNAFDIAVDSRRCV